MHTGSRKLCTHPASERRCGMKNMLCSRSQRITAIPAQQTLSGDSPSTAQVCMDPSQYSDMNTAKKGVTRSLMPWTYPLAGCLEGWQGPA